MPWDNLGRDNKQYIKQILENLKITEKDAQENEQLFQNWNKQRYDKVKHNRIQDCSIGESTVEKKPTKYPQENQKKVWDVSGVLSSIQKKGPNFTYKLMRCSNTIHLRSVINSINLRRYHDPETTLLSLSYNTENQLTKDIKERTN